MGETVSAPIVSFRPREIFERVIAIALGYTDTSVFVLRRSQIALLHDKFRYLTLQ
jgi:hypothetical protein